MQLLGIGFHHVLSMISIGNEILAERDERDEHLPEELGSLGVIYNCARIQGTSITSVLLSSKSKQTGDRTITEPSPQSSPNPISWKISVIEIPGKWLSKSQPRQNLCIVAIIQAKPLTS